MIELLILFLIVISIILCIFTLSYKCTNGTMSIDDFKTKNCIDFRYILNDDDQKTSENKSKIELPNTPLLSDTTFETITGDDDNDYSDYIDYYELSRNPVRADNDTEFKNIRSDGPGHCAKICYDKDETISGKTCNAFESDGRYRCRLYWSTSSIPAGRPRPSFGDTESDRNTISFRLKQTRDLDSHEMKKEQDSQYMSEVIAYPECNYIGTAKTLPYASHTAISEFKSLIIPNGYFAETYASSDLSGVSTLYDISQRCLPSLQRSLYVGRIVNGEYEYPIDPTEEDQPEEEEDDDDD